MKLSRRHQGIIIAACAAVLVLITLDTVASLNTDQTMTIKVLPAATAETPPPAPAPPSSASPQPGPGIGGPDMEGDFEFVQEHELCNLLTTGDFEGVVGMSFELQPDIIVSHESVLCWYFNEETGHSVNVFFAFGSEAEALQQQVNEELAAHGLPPGTKHWAGETNGFVATNGYIAQISSTIALSGNVPEGASELVPELTARLAARL